MQSASITFNRNPTAVVCNQSCAGSDMTPSPLAEIRYDNVLLAQDYPTHLDLVVDGYGAMAERSLRGYTRRNSKKTLNTALMSIRPPRISYIITWN
jgi:hypothetical protein